MNFEKVTNWKLSKHDATTSTIKCAEIESKEALFALLHELGHHVCKHDSLFSACDCAKMNKEIDAWTYASTCIKTKYHEELVGFAVYNLNFLNKTAKALFGNSIMSKPKIEKELRRKIGC